MLFSTLKDAIFITSYLGTHQLILGGYVIYMGLEYFLINFFMQWKRDFGGLKYFFENFISPSPIESPPLKVNPYQRRFCSAPSLVNTLNTPSPKQKAKSRFHQKVRQ